MSGKGGLLVLGNLFSREAGTRSVCQDLVERLEGSGWEIVSASRRRSALPKLADMLATALLHRRRYSVALVDVFSGRAFLWAEAAVRLLRWLGKPVVLALRGGNLPDFARRHPRRVRALLGLAELAVAPSEYLRIELAPYRKDIRRLPQLLALDAYPFRLRQSPRPRLVWLRAFHRIYNPRLGVEVAALLKDEFPELLLRMGGPTREQPLADATRALVFERGLSGRVEFAGPVPKREVPAFLGSGDILLNTPEIDNTPVSVLEAMALGLCVVSTRVGGIPLLLEDERDALLVPPGDAPAMAAAVRRILGEPALAQRLSENGRRKSEECDAPKVLPLWESLLREVQP